MEQYLTELKQSILLSSGFRNLRENLVKDVLVSGLNTNTK